MKKGKEEVDLLPGHMKKWGTSGSLIETFWCFLTHMCITHRVPISNDIMQMQLELNIEKK
jgi:hypothetical protein